MAAQRNLCKKTSEKKNGHFRRFNNFTTFFSGVALKRVILIRDNVSFAVPFVMVITLLLAN